MGGAFAYVQIKTILSLILRRFEFQRVKKEFPQPDFTSMVVGPEPCPVTYKRRAVEVG